MFFLHVTEMKWMTMLLHLIQQIYGWLKSAQKEKKKSFTYGSYARPGHKKPIHWIKIFHSKVKHEPWITQAWTQSTPWQACLESSLQINRECIINQNMASKPRYKTLNIIFYPKTQQYRQINALFVLGFLKTETHHLNRG